MVYAIVEDQVYKTKELSFLDKLIFERITALCHKNNYCYASNSYFANMYEVKNNAISVAIKKLKKLNLINVKYEKDIPNRSKRYIFLNDNVWLKEYTDIIPIDNGKPISKDRHNNKYNNKNKNNIIDSIYFKDDDGNEYWHGELIKENPATPKEQAEMEELLSEFRSCKNNVG